MGKSLLFYQILGLVVFLVGFGIVMVLSSSSVDAIKAGDNGFSLAGKQLLFALLGILGLSLVLRLGVDWFRRKLMAAWVFTVVLQLATVFVIGTEINGNRNWINLGIFSLQPSEILKLLMIMLLAELLLAHEDELSWNYKAWIKVASISGISIFVVILGKDMGTALVMGAILIGMLAMFGMSRPLLFWGIALGALAAIVGVMSTPSRRGRIMAWLNPDAPDPFDFNWQQSHATWAFAAGGLTGVGLGQSKLKWSWIPEAQNDFIFAIIGEEWGLLGALVIIILFVVLVYMMMRVALQAYDPYRRLIVTGIMLWIGVQAVVNIAVVLGLLPVLGVPLPLISYGGSSLIMLMIAAGFVLSVEREEHHRPRSVR